LKGFLENNFENNLVFRTLGVSSFALYGEVNKTDVSLKSEIICLSKIKKSVF
jgi:hypothetical protein